MEKKLCCPEPLGALENAGTLGKQLKLGTLIGPSDSAKNPSNRAPPALLFGHLRFSTVWAVQKVAPTAQLIATLGAFAKTDMAMAQS